MTARVLLIHGALSDRRMWEPHVARLKALAIEAEAPALTGFWPDTFDRANFSSAAQLEAIVPALTGGGPVHLVGHSRGGRLAIALATRCPDIVRSLLLMEPGGAADPAFFDAEFPRPHFDATPVFEALARGDAGEAARIYVDAGHGAGVWGSLPASFRTLAADNAATLSGTIADHTLPLSRRVAASIRCPTLLVEGAESPPLFHRIADVLEACIAESRRVRLPGADHFHPIRAPEAFADSIASWIANYTTA